MGSTTAITVLLPKGLTVLPVVCALVLLVFPVFSLPNRFLRQTDSIQSCDSLVYCQGRLLDTVQRARIFNDSKTFVDLSQKNPEDVTLKNFDDFMAEHNDTPTRAQIKEFVQNNFEDSMELADWTPEDFIPEPAFLNRIKDKDIRKFASDLVNIWPSLGRKVQSSVFQNPKQHSLIGVPHGFIIPGGRFKEFYYWDSYWIIEGLLLGEMVDTARGMIENLLSMVERYGFIPNGGRVYYLNRSQPPLITKMAYVYYNKTRDTKWLQKNIKLLDKELSFWLREKTVEIEKNGITYQMFHYFSKSTTPRPESYYEDLYTCSYFNEQAQKEHCYQGLKSGAESGWDFSSRWLFDEDGGAKTNLTHIDTQRVVPVDLNAMLCDAFQKISQFYEILGDAQNALKWRKYSETWKVSINKLLYDETDGIWYDYDMELSKLRKMFYPSNFVPLWTDSYDLALKEEYGRRAAEYFANLHIGQYKGGIPTSLINDNEQWDLPNAWPPLQEFVILGLWNTKQHKAKQIAEHSAERWIKANMKGYLDQQAMFEKYDAFHVGQYGGGGEYEVQKGFGWTNGVALYLIDQFYTSTDKTSDEGKRKHKNRKKKHNKKQQQSKNLKANEDGNEMDEEEYDLLDEEEYDDLDDDDLMNYAYAFVK